jgi:hypothetical protein
LNIAGTEKKTKEALIKLVEKALSVIAMRTRKPWLLIYDNLPGPQSQEGIALPDGGHVLITSRHNFGWEHSQINLDVFQPEESV